MTTLYARRAPDLRSLWPWLLLGLGLIALLALPGDGIDKVRFLLSGLCPQRPGHSFFFEGRQMPFEARMVGIFGGFLLSGAYLTLVARGSRSTYTPAKIGLGILFILIMGIDGINAVLTDARLPHFYTPDIRLRLATGLLAGLGFAMLLLPVAATLFGRATSLENRRLLIGPLPGALLLNGLFWWLVVSGQPWMAYPAALLAMVGVLVFLGWPILLVRQTARTSPAAETLTPTGPRQIAVGVLAAVGILLTLAILRLALERALGVSLSAL